MDARQYPPPVYNTCQLLFSGLPIRRKDIAPVGGMHTRFLFVRYGWQAQLDELFSEGTENPRLCRFGDGETGGRRGDMPTGSGLGANVGYILWLVCWLAIAGVVLSKVRHGNGEYETMKRCARRG